MKTEEEMVMMLREGRVTEFNKFREAEPAEYIRFFNANLEGVNLRGVDFHEVRLEGVLLQGADLRGADFTGARLFPSSWTETENSGPTDLRGANLGRANFTGAKLERVDLRGADLTEADLHVACLDGTRMSREQHKLFTKCFEKMLADVWIADE